MLFRETVLIQDFIILYELALAIGSSMKIIDNCEAFFKILMSRKNLTTASYWIVEPNQEIQMVWAIPKVNYKSSPPHLSSQFIETLQKEQSLIIHPNEPFFDELIQQNPEKNGCFLCYSIGTKGIFLMYRTISTFTKIEQKQLQQVMNKFGFFMEGVFSTEKLEEEINVRTQTEKALLLSQKKLEKTQFNYSILYENMFDAIFLYDYIEEKIMDCNKAGLKLLGYSKETITQLHKVDIIRPFSRYFPNIDFEEVYELNKEEVLVGNNVRTFGILVTKQGNEILANLNIVPTKEKRGEAFIIIHDMTQEIKNKKALLKSEKKYRDVFENSHQAIAIYDVSNQQFLDCNQKAVEMYGYDSKEEIIKTPITDFLASIQFDGITREELMELKLKHFRTHNRFERTIIAEKKNGTPFIVNEIVIKNEEAGKIELIFFMNDISQEYDAQKQVKERTAIYEALIHNSYDGIDIIELGNNTEESVDKLLVRNQKLKDIIHNRKDPFIKLESVLAQSPPQQKNGEDSRKYFKKVLKNIQNQGYCKYDWQIYDTNGILRDFEGIIQKLDVNDKSILIRIYQDVTERIKVQEKIKKSEANYRQLFNNAFDGIVVYSLNQKKIIRLNSKFLAFLKGEEPPLTNLSNFTQSNLQEFLPKYQPNGQTSNELRDDVFKKVIQKGSLSVEVVFLTSKGKNVITEINAFLLDIENPDNIVFIIKDITKRRERENIIQQQVQDLNQKNEELKKYIASNSDLQNFAYVASHDLRAPLRTINTFSELLKVKLKDRIDEEEEELLSFIVDSTQSMQQLIKSLLEYSKVNSVKSEMIWVDIQKLVKDIAKDLQTNIQEKKGKLLFENLPRIKGDKMKLKQLFQNLLVNALKFNKKGKAPIVKIYFEELDNAWKFYIKDNGVGIPPEFKERIFVLFKRLYSNADYEGTGIGLATCKKVVQQHGGEIGVESEKGKGATFYFTIKKDL